MNRFYRRRFLADVGRGMLVASVGPMLAADLGICRIQADETKPALSFGKLERLVALMQETPLDRLVPTLVGEIKGGTELRTLLTAAALANARTFGGQDYVGFHTFMALAPAGEMAAQLPSELAPLPVLKVLYRNTARIQAFGGRPAEVLHPVAPQTLPEGETGAEMMRNATRRGDAVAAEGVFAALMQGPAGEAYNHLQYSVQDEEDVHRVVLAWRAWSTLDLTGREHAHTLLRQSVRYCCQVEQWRKEHPWPVSQVRTVLPKLLDQYGLLGKPAGERLAEDAWIEEFSQTVFGASREQAAEAAAAALAEGISPVSIGEAISLAANQLVLHDPGREAKNSSREKPAGCVHGDSVGVHASDSANAWRNIAAVSDHRNSLASLIVAAFHTAGQSNRVRPELFPYAEELSRLDLKDAAALVRETEAAIKANEQARVCAIVQRYGDLKLPERPMFDLLLRYGISQDGALHAEKFYNTVTEEFGRTRPAFRWRHVISLARVTASEHGFPSPGYHEAKDLLKV